MNDHQRESGVHRDDIGSTLFAADDTLTGTQIETLIDGLEGLFVRVREDANAKATYRIRQIRKAISAEIMQMEQLRPTLDLRARAVAMEWMSGMGRASMMIAAEIAGEALGSSHDPEEINLDPIRKRADEALDAHQQVMIRANSARRWGRTAAVDKWLGKASISADDVPALVQEIIRLRGRA